MKINMLILKTLAKNYMKSRPSFLLTLQCVCTQKSEESVVNLNINHLG